MKVERKCSPAAGEKQNDFVGRCMSEISDTKPDWAQDKKLAACFSEWREAKKAELVAAVRKGAAKVKALVEAYQAMETTDGRVAKAITSTEVQHAHPFEVDAEGNGRTTSTILMSLGGGAQPHEHEIGAYAVKEAEGHSHEISRLAKSGGGSTGVAKGKKKAAAGVAGKTKIKKKAEDLAVGKPGDKDHKRADYFNKDGTFKDANVGCEKYMADVKGLSKAQAGMVCRVALSKNKK